MFKKYAMVLAVLLGIGGTVALISATYISTVTIPDIEGKLSDVVESIDKYRFNSIMSFMEKLQSEHHVTQKQIWLFHRNLLVGKEEAKERTEELALKALKEAVRLARGAFDYFDAETDNLRKLKSEEKLNNILNDENLSAITKVAKVEEVWKENQSFIADRFRLENEKLRKGRELRKEIEEEKLCVYKKFVKMQIGGLIALAFAGLIEGTIKTFTPSKNI